MEEIFHGVLFFVHVNLAAAELAPPCLMHASVFMNVKRLGMNMLQVFVRYVGSKDSKYKIKRC